MRNQTLALVEPTDIVKKLVGWPDECGRTPSVLGWKWSLMGWQHARTPRARARRRRGPLANPPETITNTPGTTHEFS